MRSKAQKPIYSKEKLQEKNNFNHHQNSKNPSETKQTTQKHHTTSALPIKIQPKTKQTTHNPATSPEQQKRTATHSVTDRNVNIRSPPLLVCVGHCYLGVRDLKVRTRELSANGGRKSRSSSRIEMFTARFSFSQLSRRNFRNSNVRFLYSVVVVVTSKLSLFSLPFLRFASGGRFGGALWKFGFVVGCILFFLGTCTFGY